MRSKKALLNISILLVLRVIAIVSGLIVPRLIISTYGSDINGLMVAVNQFMGYIVLMELGVGGVIRASLYKPLSSKNIEKVSGILKAAQSFFRVVAGIFIVYITVLALIFPKIVESDFSTLFIVSFVFIIGASSFFQYFFGITYQILLQADQRQYIISLFQILTLILNTFLIVILVNMGFSIHFVIFGSAVIFTLRPILLNLYVKKKFRIIQDIQADKKAINQKWDGLGHHIAFLLHNNTDVALITYFVSLKEVSVYSIYYMIVSSIQSLTVTFASGLEAAFGNMIANKEKTALERNFNLFEFIIYTITSILFSSLALLILSFIELYTISFSDADYYRPLFAYILIISGGLYCIRVPYSSVVLAAGHYKQTKNGAYLEAIINIVISLILVKSLGIIGVALGTLSAVLIRTIQYAVYLSKNIIKRSIWFFYKRIIVYSINITVIIIFALNFMDYSVDSYKQWLVSAILTVIISIAFTAITNILFYFKDIKLFISVIKKVFKR